MQSSAVSMYETKPGRGRAVATVDTMVTGHEWAGGVTHGARRATGGSDDDTMVNSVLHGLGLLPDRVDRTRASSMGDHTGSARSVPSRPGTSPGTDESTRRGRHAKPAAGAGWARDRALPLLRENRRVVLAAAVILVLVVVVARIAGWGSSPGKSCGLFYAGNQGSDVCADAGGTASMAGLTVSATPLALLDNAAGARSLCTSIELTNDSGDDRAFSAVDFKIQNPAGEMTSTINGSLRAAGTLAAGESATGTMCDDRPAQAGVYALIYEPSVLGAPRGVWLSEH